MRPAATAPSQHAQVSLLSVPLGELEKGKGLAVPGRGKRGAAFDAILGVVDEVIAIELADVERARTIVLGMPKLSARDALHAAVMGRQRIERIMTFDTAFDGVPGLSRYRT